ncbi:DUF2182 domain-containing protein [Pseudohalocynthiibacter aestuariivivens]|uniref:DUF2182 domain-containing protein n=1 Tax=Pseudohalocynthiibacter aestuariivivens TaxID=1591409 RepID=A0ABV5JCS6_9RHOB|nr:DUF2182 domain-containing protein [Pseudohalocynthiibacter aestuariivivens]MBS9717256.1 DUF2182 domain-containing protein [Pseudohalocynthiibacter aestuariivivens]
MRTNQEKTTGPVERLVRSDQRIVLGSVALLVVIAAVYTVAGVGMNMSAIEMTQMARTIGDPMPMATTTPWTLTYASLIVLMWWVMMIAMMTPSAAPMVLLFTALKRMGPENDKATIFSSVFLCGYLIIWAFFSAAAAALQWGLEALSLSEGAMMTINSRGFAGTILVVAGAYQFTGLKHACLTHCRSPAHFLSKHIRPGATGAFRTGAHHGTYCLGCCWALMALLFVGGIMNLYWIVGLTIYVLIEKLVPNGLLVSRLTGAVLVGVGSFYLFTELL